MTVLRFILGAVLAALLLLAGLAFIAAATIGIAAFVTATVAVTVRVMIDILLWVLR